MSTDNHTNEPTDLDLLGELSEEDPIGYQLDFDWSELDEAEVAEHDRIIGLEPDEVLALDLKALNDLHAWAAAQVLADNEELESFAEIVDRLIHASQKHPALDYSEIAGERIYDHISEGELEAAEALLPVLRGFEDNEHFLSRRIEVILAFAREQSDIGFERLQKLVDSFDTDPFALIDIGSDMLGCEEFEAGRSIFEKALELAEAEADQELIEDIRLVLSEIDEMEKEAGQA